MRAASMDQHQNGSAEPDERSSLLNHHVIHNWTHTSNGDPLYKSENRAVRWPSSLVHKVWQVLATNYVNVFLVFVPLGIISGLAKWDPVTQFILNFIAIIPLASLLAFATEELAVPLGQTVGGLLNATFGNAVELIVSISSNLIEVTEKTNRHTGQYYRSARRRNPNCTG